MDAPKYLSLTSVTSNSIVSPKCWIFFFYIVFVFFSYCIYFIHLWVESVQDGTGTVSLLSHSFVFGNVSLRVGFICRKVLDLCFHLHVRYVHSHVFVFVFYLLVCVKEHFLLTAFTVSSWCHVAVFGFGNVFKKCANQKVVQLLNHV